MNNDGEFQRTARILLLLAAASALLGSAAPADSDVTVTDAKVGDVYRVVAQNKTVGDVTVVVNFARLRNMTSSRGDEVVLQLGSHAKAHVSDLAIVNKKLSGGINYDYAWCFGRRDGKVDAEHVYQLPFEPNMRVRVSQGYNGGFSHKGPLRYALDFALPERTTVFAARGGLVVKVVDKFSQGGPSRAFKQKGNVILVLHRDGTVGDYGHFVKDGARVKVGDKVQAGSLLGLSGNTGQTRGPHLHFGVYRVNDKGNPESIKTLFETAHGVTHLVEQQFYARPSDSP